jgi:DNA-binding SARP family transcriptional activator
MSEITRYELLTLAVNSPGRTHCAVGAYPGGRCFHMRFGILGPTEFRDGDTPIPLGAAKQRGLLAVLLLNAGRPVRVDILIEHLWPGGGTADHRQILYSLVSRLRATLSRHGLRHALSRVADAYQLDVPPASVDVHRFRALVDRSRAALADDQPAVAAASLQQAVDLWRGDPLPELRGPAAEDLREWLAGTLLDAHKLLATARLRAGEHDKVLAQLEHLIREYDVDEPLARLWIGALSAAGREDEARRYLVDFRRRFRRELGTNARIDLDATEAGRPRPAPGRPRQLPADIPGFVGRVDLLAELDRIAAPGSRTASVVVISGMAGIGKPNLENWHTFKITY